MTLKNREINKKNLQTIITQLSPKTSIMAVTKTLSNKAIESAVKNKILLIGENKVQETTQKKIDPQTRKKIQLHLIGQLQTNKIKKAVNIYDVIETVEKEKQLTQINKEAKRIKKKQKIYIQINIGEMDNKGGVLTNKLDRLAQQANNHENIIFSGLMTILPHPSTKEEKTTNYKKMKIIHDKTKQTYPQCTGLSMGMSGDYILASKLGATHVRIGTFLYGER